MTKEVPSFSTLEDKIKLNNAVREAVQAHERIADTKSFLNDVAERVQEELGLAKADFNKLVAERFNDKQSDVLAKAQEIVDLNEALVEAERVAKKNQQG